MRSVEWKGGRPIVLTAAEAKTDSSFAGRGQAAAAAAGWSADVHGWPWTAAAVTTIELGVGEWKILTSKVRKRTDRTVDGN